MVVKMRNLQARILGLCTGHKLPPSKKAQELEMTEKQLQILMSDKTFKSWQRLGMVVLVQEAPKGGRPDFVKSDEVPSADLLEGTSAAQAKATILATSDTDLLEAWHVKDTRKTVKKAIEDRLASLEPEKSEDEDEDEDDFATEDEEE